MNKRKKFETDFDSLIKALLLFDNEKQIWEEKGAFRLI